MLRIFNKYYFIVFYSAGCQISRIKVGKRHLPICSESDFQVPGRDVTNLSELDYVDLNIHVTHLSVLQVSRQMSVTELEVRLLGSRQRCYSPLCAAGEQAKVSHRAGGEITWIQVESHGPPWVHFLEGKYISNLRLRLTK